MNKKISIGPWTISNALWSQLPKNTKYTTQTHQNIIVDEKSIKQGLTKADGIITHIKSPPVAIRTADCLPMVILTNDKAVLLHISRKTLVNGLLEKIEKNIDIKKIINIYLGPHICPTHFTFDYEGEEIKKFQKMFPHATYKENKIHLSIKDALQYYFEKWGVNSDRIIKDIQCTYENKNIPSYKRSLDELVKLNNHLATIVSS